MSTFPSLGRVSVENAASPSVEPATPVAPRLPLAGALILLALGVAHRTAVFILHLPDLRHLIAGNSDWLTWQFPSIAALSNHLAASLFFLQQAPPIPNLILGVIMKLAAWPFAVDYLLIGLQAVLSTATAILMFRIQLFFTQRVYLALFAAAVFLLSSDLLLFEYNSLGQTFYEDLAMFFVLVATYLFFRLAQTESVTYSLLLGLATALLALSRASFSYFFIVPIVFLAVLRPAHLRRHVLAFVLCGLSLQVAWSLKNAFVYGRFSLNTSSWAGTNFEVGLKRVGLGELFLSSILEDPDAYPDWFIAMNREEGLVLWNPAYVRYLPQNVLDRDQRTQHILDGTATATDSYGQSIVSELYMRAYTRFARKYPEAVLQKFWASYLMFWQPIRNYAIQYVDLFYVKPIVEDPFAFGVILNDMLSGKIPEQQYLMSEQWHLLRPKRRDAKKVHTYSLTLLPTLFWMRNVVAFHLLAPMLLGIAAMRRIRGRKPELPVEYVFMLCVIAYLALVSNLAEFGENMRFRLSVEPLIWISSAFGLRILFGVLGRLKRSAAAPPRELAEPRGAGGAATAALA